MKYTLVRKSEEKEKYKFFHVIYLIALVLQLIFLLD